MGRLSRAGRVVLRELAIDDATGGPGVSGFALMRRTAVRFRLWFVLQGLERRGWVVEREEPDDGRNLELPRRVFYRLTPAGRMAASGLAAGNRP